MEQNSKNPTLIIVLILIAIGIWSIVLQNAGIIPSKQNVYVKGGYLSVSGEVNIDETVDVSGYVDVNLAAINGKENAFYDHNGNRVYDRIPVYTGGY